MKKTKLILLAALALALVLGLAATASATTPTPQNSEAKIEFTPGEIIVIPPGGYDDLTYDFINLDFGTRKRPTRAEVYFANGTGGSDSGEKGATGTKLGIAVGDGREAVAPWNLSVSMTQFGTGADAWGSELYLLRGQTSTNSTTPASLTLVNTTGTGNTFTHPYPSQTAIYEANVAGIKITTGASPAIFLRSTNANLGTGTHGAFWDASDIKLYPKTDWAKIKPQPYTSEMTWTIGL